MIFSLFSLCFESFIITFEFKSVSSLIQKKKKEPIKRKSEEKINPQKEKNTMKSEIIRFEKNKEDETKKIK